MFDRQRTLSLLSECAPQLLAASSQKASYTQRRVKRFSWQRSISNAPAPGLAAARARKLNSPSRRTKELETVAGRGHNGAMNFCRHHSAILPRSCPIILWPSHFRAWRPPSVSVLKPVIYCMPTERPAPWLVAPASNGRIKKWPNSMT